jgi:hypothetical protein
VGEKVIGIKRRWVEDEWMQDGRLHEKRKTKGHVQKESLLSQTLKLLKQIDAIDRGRESLSALAICCATVTRTNAIM